MDRTPPPASASPALGGALARGVVRRAEIHRSLLARGSAVGPAALCGAGGPLAIRRSVPADVDGLRDLAQLDSARVPAEPLLVAEHGGRLVAAIGILNRRVIADPWLPTATAVDLLQVAAAEARGPERRRRWTARLPWRGGSRARGAAAGAAD